MGMCFVWGSTILESYLSLKKQLPPLPALRQTWPGWSQELLTWERLLFLCQFIHPHSMGKLLNTVCEHVSIFSWANYLEVVNFQGRKTFPIVGCISSIHHMVQGLGSVRGGCRLICCPIIFQTRLWNWWWLTCSSHQPPSLFQGNSIKPLSFFFLFSLKFCFCPFLVLHWVEGRCYLGCDISPLVALLPLIFFLVYVSVLHWLPFFVFSLFSPPMTG